MSLIGPKLAILGNAEYKYHMKNPHILQNYPNNEICRQGKSQ
jgi:hypothetical protein